MPDRPSRVRAYELEGLEQRIMLSADTAAILAGGAMAGEMVSLPEAESGATLPLTGGALSDLYNPAADFDSLAAVPQEEVESSTETSAATAADIAQEGDEAGDTASPLVATQSDPDIPALNAEIESLAAQWWGTSMTAQGPPASRVRLDDEMSLSGQLIVAETIVLGNVQFSGENRLFANHIVIEGDFNALPGSVLTLAPLHAADEISLGREAVGFHLSAADLDALSGAGFAELIIGHVDGSHVIHIDHLTYAGSLTLRAPETGGAFHVDGPILHSGGELTFLGSGQTQNTSADTITSGSAININDTVQLVYVDGVTNVWGPNTFYLDTTNNGAVPAGANISITGDIRGTTFGRGGVLYLNAGTSGTILINGNIGTEAGLEGIVIKNAGSVQIDGNIEVDFFTQEAGSGSTVLGTNTASFVRLEEGSLSITTTNNITIRGNLEVAFEDAIFNITGTSGTRELRFQGEVDLSRGDLEIQRARRVIAEADVAVEGNLIQTIGLLETSFRGDVIAGSIHVRANDQIEFRGSITMLVGDLTLISNHIDFEGGEDSVVGAIGPDNEPLSRAYLRPINAGTDMNLGSPSGATTSFPFGPADILAMRAGWQMVTFGYESGSTNLARIGNAAFKNPVTVYAGEMIVNGATSARGALILDAASGDILFTSQQALVSVANQQVDGVWQSSSMTVTARQGDVLFSNGAWLRVQNDPATDASMSASLSVTALEGSIRDLSVSRNRQTAAEVSLLAAQEIDVWIEAASLQAESSAEGDITIDEINDVHVLMVVANNGAISLDAGGTVRIDWMESATDNADNTIHVTALGNIEVGRIRAGAEGDVTLSAGGQIVGFSASERAGILDLPLIILSGGDDGQQGLAQLVVDGEVIEIRTDSNRSDANGFTFTLLGALETSDGDPLDSVTPVRVVEQSGGEAYAIYALPGTATHAHVVAALDALPGFEATLVGDSSVLDLPYIVLMGGTSIAFAAGEWVLGDETIAIVADQVGTAFNGTQIVFVGNAVAPSASWNGVERILTVRYVPGRTTLERLVELINETDGAIPYQFDVTLSDGEDDFVFSLLADVDYNITSVNLLFDREPMQSPVVTLAGNTLTIRLRNNGTTTVEALSTAFASVSGFSAAGPDDDTLLSTDFAVTATAQSLRIGGVDFSATLDSILEGTTVGVAVATVTEGREPVAASGSYEFGADTVIVTADQVGAATNGTTIYFVGDETDTESVDWNAVIRQLTLGFVSGETSLDVVGGLITGVGAGVTASVVGDGAAILSVQAVQLNDGRNGIPAFSDLTIDGLNIRVEDMTGAVESGGPVIRVIAAAPDSVAPGLTPGDPAVAVIHGGDVNLYLLAGVATHVDVIAALNALPDFSARLVDPHVEGDRIELQAETGIGQVTESLQLRGNEWDVENTNSGPVRLLQDHQRGSVTVRVANESSATGDHVAIQVLGPDVMFISHGITNSSNGGIRVQVAGAAELNGKIESENGPVTVEIVDELTLSAGATIQSHGGDVAIIVLADIEMAVDAVVTSDGGNIVVWSDPGNIVLGVLNAGNAEHEEQDTWGDVAVYAPSGWIRDHAGSEAANVFASALQLFSGAGIGQLPDNGTERTVEIDAVQMAASSQDFGTILIRDVNDLETTRVESIAYARLQADGSAIVESGFGGLEAVVAHSGGDLLIRADGVLVLDPGLGDTAVRNFGVGHIALLANSLTIRGDVRAAEGNISASVSGDMSIVDGAQIVTTDSNTIGFSSSGGSLLAAADTVFQAGSGAIVLSAQNSMTLGRVVTTGSVGVRAVTGSIRAAAGGDSGRVVIEGDTLALVAGGSVDGPSDAAAMLITDVIQISLAGGLTGAVYRIHNLSPLTIDTTSATAMLYDALMASSPLAIAPQSDFAVSGAGHIALHVEGDGSLGANRTIATTGAGTITIATEGVFAMGSQSLISNQDGSVNIDAAGSVYVGRIASDSGDIQTSSATGSIVDADPSEIGVHDFETTGRVTLLAHTGIGVIAGTRETLAVDIGQLYAETHSGGIFIATSSSLETVGLLSHAVGTPISVVVEGSLTVGPDEHGVAVSATGDVVLVASGDWEQLPDSSLSSDADIRLGAGGDMDLVHVAAAGAVALSAAGAVMGYPQSSDPAILATGLLLDGVGSVGTPAQPLVVAVEQLAGTVLSGGLAVRQLGDVGIGLVEAETTPVQTELENVLSPPFVQTGDQLVVSGSGTGVFVEVQGTLTVHANALPTLVVAEAIPVLWESAGQQQWNGVFHLGGGPLTLRAGQTISLNAAGVATTGNGSVSIETESMFGVGSGFELNRGAGDLVALVGGSIFLSGAISGTGDAALIASGAIMASPGGSLPHVAGSGLLLRSSVVVGMEGIPVTTAVSALSVHTGARGMAIQNSGALEITNLGVGVASVLLGNSLGVAFSGHQGGLVALQSGSIWLDNEGEVTVQNRAAAIAALPGTGMAFSVLMDEAGPGGNDYSVLFEIIRSDASPIDANDGLFDGEGNPLPEDLRTGIPPSTKFSESDGVLRVYVRNNVSTMAEVLAAINADPEFPGVAVLGAGQWNGTTIFSRTVAEETSFAAAGGAYEGVLSQLSGELSGGAEAVGASAELEIPDQLFTIRIDADSETGDAINNVTVRLLDDGPLPVAEGGRLNPGTDAALIEWDQVGGLDIFINFGVTTVGTVIARINTQEGIPFAAQLGGTFGEQDLDYVLGEGFALMQADLSATAELRPTGPNNDFAVTATVSGSLYNGIHFEFVDHGTVPPNGAVATFNPVTNVMTLQIQSGVTTANQVIAALNAEGTFSATLIPETASANNGAGPIQATRFFTVGGAVAVYASAELNMVGSNNGVTVTATEFGDDYNQVEIRFVSDNTLSPGVVEASYNAATKLMELRVNPSFTSAVAIEEAINNLAGVPFAASSDGSGTITLAHYPFTTGGSGSVARADFIAVGPNNDFEIVADEAIPSLVNIEVILFDDGTITDGSATAEFLPDPVRRLLLNVQSGVTTANALLTAINSGPNSASIPLTASLLSGNDGSGTFGIQAATFAGGVEALAASVNVILQSGAEVRIVAEQAGTAMNGVQVSFAVDDDLPPETGWVAYLNSETIRLLQLRVDDVDTPLSALQAALASDPQVPFTLSTVTRLLVNQQSIRIVPETATADLHNAQFRVVGALVAGDATVLDSETPVHIVEGAGVYTIYVLPHVATRGEIAAAINALAEFSATLTGQDGVVSVPLITLDGGVDPVPYQYTIEFTDGASTYVFTISAATDQDIDEIVDLTFDLGSGALPEVQLDGTTLRIRLRADGTSQVGQLRTALAGLSGFDAAGPTGADFLDTSFTVSSSEALSEPGVQATGSVSLAGGVISILSDLLDASANGTRIVFVGDADVGSADWDAVGQVLTVRFVAGATTLGELLDWMNGSGAPLVAELESVGQAELVVEIDAVTLRTLPGLIASVQNDSHEGAIALSAAGDIALIGRVVSEPGGVVIATRDEGDLTFDAATTLVSGVDRVELDLDGAFANVASTEVPLIQVRGEGVLSIHTGSQAVVSTEPIVLKSAGDIHVTGTGMAVEDGFLRLMSVELVAEGDITLSAPIRVLPTVDNADGITFELIKATEDGEGNALSAGTPVVVEQDGSTYRIYALPGVATHENVMDAIQAIAADGVALFFAELGRQEGTLIIGGNRFFITSTGRDVVENVMVQFVDATAPVQAAFAGSTITISLGQFDNATIEGLLVALNALPGFSATTSAVDVAAPLRTGARSFESDYMIEIVGATEDGNAVPLTVANPVSVIEVNGIFTVYALPDVATRLQIRDALIGTGVFSAVVPELDHVLTIGDNEFFIRNLGQDDLTGVTLEFGFVEDGTVDIQIVGGILELLLDNVDLATGADILSALQDIPDFIVYTLSTVLDQAIEDDSPVVDFVTIPAGERSAPLTLSSPVEATLTVSVDGVFAEEWFLLEGMLVSVNWLVPTVTPGWEITTEPESRSAFLQDDAIGAVTVLSYETDPVLASAWLIIDGVEIAIWARSAGVLLAAGGAIVVDDNGAVHGGRVTLMADDSVRMDGELSGGPISIAAHATIEQGGAITAVGTGTITVVSVVGDVLMTGTATLSSESGEILIQGAGDVAIGLLESSGGARIDVVSGGAIVDAQNSASTNIATTGLVVLTAQNGIGAIGAADLGVEVGRVVIRNFGATGDIVVTQRAAGGDVEVEELTQQADTGWTILVIDDGDVLLSGAALHLGSGALLLQGAGGFETTVDAPITLQGGTLNVMVQDDIQLHADIATQGGDIYMTSTVGALSMLPSITLDADGGDVVLVADLDLDVAQISSVGAGVRVESQSGAVVRAAADGRTNVIATTLQFYAGTAIGGLAALADAMIVAVDLFTATASAGGLAVRELGSLRIGDAEVSVTVLYPDRSTDTTMWTEDQLLTLAGDAVLQVGGSLTIEAIDAPLSTVQLAGEVRFDVGNSTTMDGDVEVTGGALHVVVGMNASLRSLIEVDGGTLLIEVGGLLVQTTAGAIRVNDADAILASSGSMSISQIDVGLGSLALTSGGTLTRQTAAASPHVTAQSVRLQAVGTIGSTAASIIMDASVLTALTAGGIHVWTVGDLAIDTVEVEANSVSLLGDAMADPSRVETAQSDLRSTGGGNILLDVAGLLELFDGDNANGIAVQANGAGRIYLSGVTLDAYADVVSVEGHITILADGDMRWVASGDPTLYPHIRSDSGDLVVQSQGMIAMDDGTRFLTLSGNAFVSAVSNFEVAGVHASQGFVVFDVGGAVLDSGNLHVDVIADQWQVVAGTGVGLLGAGTYDPIDVTVNRLSARILSGPYAVAASSGVEVGTTSGEIAKVQLNGTVLLVVQELNALYGIESMGGGSVSLVSAGSVTVLSAGDDNDGISTTQSGNIVVQGSALSVNDSVSTQQGHITLTASGLVQLGVDVVIESTDGGAITLRSTANALTQAVGGIIRATTADIVIQAHNNVTLAALETGGNVAVTSTSGSILEGAPAQVHVTAVNVRLLAGGNIGQGTNPIRLQATRLALQTSNGGAFIEEVDALTLSIAAAETMVVSADGTVELVTVAALSGVTTGGSSGTIVIRAMNGNLTVATGHVVMAAGSGRILLEASAQLIVQHGVTSGSGSISLLSGGDMIVNEGILVQTGGSGQIQAIAGGRIEARANSRFVALLGHLLLQAGGDLDVGGLQTLGRAALISEAGSIRGSGSTDFDHEVVASRLLLDAAQGGVGRLAPTTPAESFRTNVGRLAAVGGGHGVHVVNGATLLVADVSVSTQQVLPTGQLGASRVDVLADVRTVSGNGRIVLRTTAGTITLNDGDENGIAVQAHGSGHVRISAEGANADVLLNAEVRSATGHITILAARHLHQQANISTSGAGTIDVAATAGSITMSDGSQALGLANLSYVAAGDIVVGGLSANHMRIQAGGNITSSGTAHVDVIATAAQLVATSGSIGALNTTISTLAAQAGGSLRLTNSEDLIIGSVAPVSVQRVGMNGATTTQVGLTVSGLAVDDLIRLNVMGDLEQVAGQIVTGDLAFESAGAVTFAGANQINVVAGVADGPIVINNSQTLTISTVDGIAGLTSSERVRLVITTGNVGQAESIVSPELVFDVAGNVILTESNQVDLLAGVAGGRIEFTNATDLMITSVDGIAGLSTVDVIVLQTLSGNLEQAEEILAAAFKFAVAGDLFFGESNWVGTIAGEAGGHVLFVNEGTLTIGTVAGTSGLIGDLVRVESTADVTQSSGPVVAQEFVFIAVGEVNLPENNVIERMAGQAAADISIFNVPLLTIATVDGVEGLMTPAIVRLTVGAGISQDAGVIVSDHFAFWSLGDVLLPEANRVNLVSGSSTGSVLFNNDQSLSVAVIDSLSGVAAGGDLELLVAGHLTRTGAAVVTGDDVYLQALTGLGETGSGMLLVNAETLTFANQLQGSAYLMLVGAIVVGGGMLSGPGYLYLTVVGGDLSVIGDVDVEEGSAIIRVGGDFNLDANLTAFCDIRIQADHILLHHQAAIVAATRTLHLLASGDIEMDVGALVHAQLEDVVVRSGGDVVLGAIRAGRAVDLHARGDIRHDAIVADVEVEGASVRLSADGAIVGVVTQTDRLDTISTGNTTLNERNDLRIGRFGLQLRSGDTEAVLELNVLSSAVVGSVQTEAMNVVGAGLFRLVSGSQITLSTQLVQESGNLRIEVNRLVLGSGAQIRNEGTGRIDLRVTGGGFEMNVGNLLRGRGAVDIQARDTITISRVESLGHSTRIESYQGAILRRSAVTPNIVTLSTHVVRFFAIAGQPVNMVVDADQASVNVGNTWARGSSTYITINFPG